MPEIREIEAQTIRDFVTMAAEGGYLSGKVLDFGAGDQPYRDIVETVGGTYIPVDTGYGKDATWVGHVERPLDEAIVAHHPFDAVLCTQVIEYMNNPLYMIGQMHYWLRKGGHLVMTGPTNWPIVQQEDLWRFTPAGISRYVSGYFEIVTLIERGHFTFGGDSRWILGWGVIARA